MILKDKFKTQILICDEVDDKIRRKLLSIIYTTVIYETKFQIRRHLIARVNNRIVNSIFIPIKHQMEKSFII